MLKNQEIADHSGQPVPTSPHNPAQADKAQVGGSAPARSAAATPQQQQQARRYYVRRKAEHRAAVRQERQANAARTREQLNREDVTRRTVKVKQGQVVLSMTALVMGKVLCLSIGGVSEPFFCR